MERPRLLLVSEVTELSWTIRPHLEEWADVASFDPPGVGGEPLPPGQGLSTELVVQRGLQELDGRDWKRCFLVADGYSNATAARIAQARLRQVEGLALGHARLSNRREGERAPINQEVWEAMTQVLRQDQRGFIRHGIVQATHGSVDEDLAEQILERLPEGELVDSWEALSRDDHRMEELLAGLEVPLLFAKHDGCLMSTAEGFEDACKAFPQARIVSVPEAPPSSEEFAEALREFCEGVLSRNGGT